jgi:hypothetical protein
MVSIERERVGVWASPFLAQWFSCERLLLSSQPKRNDSGEDWLDNPFKSAAGRKSGRIAERRVLTSVAGWQPLHPLSQPTRWSVSRSAARELKQPVPPAQITLVIRPNVQGRCLFIQPGPFSWPSQPASLRTLLFTVGFDQSNVGTVVIWNGR